MRRFIVLLILLLSVSLYAGTMHIVTPYLGSLDNNLEVTSNGQTLKLDDSALMEGVYYLCINPAKFQWNVFIYGSQDINSSHLFGTHLIYDRYFQHSESGRYAIGVGLDFLQIKTDADELQGLQDFKMTNNIMAPYIRAGRYFNFTQGINRYSVFLWGGFERDVIRGDVDFTISNPMMPFPVSVSSEIDSDYHYALAGLALKGTFFHFLEIKVKYHRKFSLDDKDSFHVFSAMTNVYMSRKWGVSYRFKHMEETFGDNVYHIGGVFYVF